MTDIDIYADLYLNFEDRQEWIFERLTAFTFAEYMVFVEYVFKETDLAFEAGEHGEFVRIKGLLMAIARKQLELGHFLAGQTDEQQAVSHRIAQSYFDLARDYYPEALKPGVDAAWAATQDYAARYGASSPIFGVLHHDPVFKN